VGLDAITCPGHGKGRGAGDGPISIRRFCPRNRASRCGRVAPFRSHAKSALIGELAVTETESHPRTRALVASFLFIDLVGYSKGTAADQYAEKAALSDLLTQNLAALRKDDYRVKDTGDGALIAFLSSPEHALYMALAIGEDFQRIAVSAGFPSNSLRTGLHIGAVKEALDLEARPNFVGDGINAAKRIMDFAAPGQITASRAYFEAVSWLDSSYAALFQHLGASDDKHGRAHELYAVSTSAAVLEKLRLDLAPTGREIAERDAKSISSTGERGSTPTRRDGASGTLRWLVFVGAAVAIGVLASIYLRSRPADPVTLTARPVAPDTTPSPSPPATPVAPMAADPAPVPAPPPSPTPSPKSDAAASSPARQAAEGTAERAISRPAPPVPSSPQLSGADSRRKPSEASSTPVAVPSGQRSARCQHIMEKATLGETLSPDEKRELASSCR